MSEMCMKCYKPFGKEFMVKITDDLYVCVLANSRLLGKRK